VPEFLPKIGIQMTLAEPFQRFTRYGRGPFETYPDRKTGAKIGIYSGFMDEPYTPYLVPQDYGNKTDVPWAGLTNSDGIGLFVTGDSLVNVGVQSFSMENLTRALYPFRLIDQDGVTLNVDHKVSGVGETPIHIRLQYRVPPKEHRYRVKLRPFDANEVNAVELGRQEFLAGIEIGIAIGIDVLRRLRSGFGVRRLCPVFWPGGIALF
jgi:beta-galactosidase